MLKFLIALCIFAVVNADNGVVFVFDPTGTSQVTGTVNFTTVSNGVHVQGEIKGLKPGLHGFHIHKLGNIGPGCTGTAGHFNPYNKNHGAPSDSERHVGDLGNINADANGIASIDITDNIISLSGSSNIIGRGVVVHALADDLGKGGNADSLVTGNAGGRVACGVIGILESTSTSAGTSIGLHLGVFVMLLMSIM